MMKNNFYENVVAFQKKESKTIKDYINYIKALTYVLMFEYNDNCSYAALSGLEESDVQIIADYFTHLGFKCNYRSDSEYLMDNGIFYRFYLEW